MIQLYLDPFTLPLTSVFLAVYRFLHISRSTSSIARSSSNRPYLPASPIVRIGKINRIESGSGINPCAR